MVDFNILNENFLYFYVYIKNSAVSIKTIFQKFTEWKYIMDEELLGFFRQHKSKDEGETYTHVSMSEPKGKAYISQRDENELYSHQQRIAETDGISFVAEKNQNCMPILIDFDIKYNNDDDELSMERRYTQDDIRRLVKIYFETFRDIFVSFDENRLVCCLLEKKKLSVTNDGTIKDGFHLHFPFFVTESHIQMTVIRKRVIEAIRNDKQLSKTFRRPEKLIDEKVPNVCWLMYGSRKSAEKEPYLLTHVYNRELQDVKFESIFGDKFIAKHLSIHLATRTTSNFIALKPEEIIMSTPKHKVEKTIYQNKRLTSESIQDAKILLCFVDKERADSRSSWFDIGACLFNICGASEDAYQLWLDFSKRCPNKFNEEECRRIWDQEFKPSNRTLGTIIYYAMQDNPEAYNKWKHKKHISSIEGAFGGTDFNIANLLKDMYGDRYVCVSTSKSKWYHFENHRWHFCEDSSDLEKEIYYEVGEKLADRLREYNNIIKEGDREDEEMDKIKEKRDKCYSLKNLLQKSAKITAVMRVARVLFADNSFMKKLDTNPDLVCFKNGIYDLRTDEFRSGKADDYISICTNTDYKEFSWKEPAPILNELIKLINRVFVNPNEREYYLKFIASCWRGQNINKIFVAMLGQPNTSKSTMNKLVQKCFGEYCISISSTTFTSKKPNGSQATPDWYRLKSCRLGTTQEPSADEEINIGTFKELTGNDRFTARPMYGSPEDIDPQVKFYIMTNKVPAIPSNDPGSFVRLRVLIWGSIFVDDPPETEEEQFAQRRFPKILNLDSKLDEFVQPFTWLLLQKFREYRMNNYIIYEPPEVTRSTDEFREQNDITSRFEREHIIKTNTDEDIISLTEINTIFRRWYRINYPLQANKKAVSADQLRDMLKIRWGEPTGRNVEWKGRQIKDEDMMNNKREEKNESQNHIKDSKRQTPKKVQVEERKNETSNETNNENNNKIPACNTEITTESTKIDDKTPININVNIAEKEINIRGKEKVSKKTKIINDDTININITIGSDDEEIIPTKRIRRTRKKINTEKLQKFEIKNHEKLTPASATSMHSHQSKKSTLSCATTLSKSSSSSTISLKARLSSVILSKFAGKSHRDENKH